MKEEKHKTAEKPEDAKAATLRAWRGVLCGRAPVAREGQERQAAQAAVAKRVIAEMQ